MHEAALAVASGGLITQWVSCELRKSADSIDDIKHIWPWLQYWDTCCITNIFCSAVLLITTSKFVHADRCHRRNCVDWSAAYCIRPIISVRVLKYVRILQVQQCYKIEIWLFAAGFSEFDTVLHKQARTRFVNRPNVYLIDNRVLLWLCRVMLIVMSVGFCVIVGLCGRVFSVFPSCWCIIKRLTLL